MAAGASAGQALRVHHRAGPAHRGAGVPPVLGGRAPQHAGHRQFRPGRADRPPGRGDLHDPGRLGRRDAAQPRPAGGGRAVRHAGGAAPGPDRPGHRPGPRHRPAHRAGAAAHHGGALGRGVPAGAGRPDRLLPRGGPAAADHRDARAGATCPRSGCSAPAGSAPSSPGCSACRSRSRTTSARPTPCRRWPCTGSTSGRPSGWSGRTRWWRSSAICADTDERAAVAGRAGRAVVPAAAVRDAGAAGHPRGGGGLPVHRPGAGIRPAALRRPGHRLPGNGPPAAGQPARRGPPPTS